MDELDAEPTIEELEKAVDALSNRKAPGSDGMHPTRGDQVQQACPL